MAQEPIYNPDAPKRGRPPKVKSPLEETKPSAAVAADHAIEVEEAISADASLAEAPPTDGETLEQAVSRIRQVRSAFGASTFKLALPKRAGYHRHWFNDVPGRLDEAKASGWSHIKDDEGKPLNRVVGTGRTGSELRAFAMELPTVFWEEDMAARHKVAQDKIESIKKQPFQSKPGQAQASDQGKFYSPTEGAEPITIRQPTG